MSVSDLFEDILDSLDRDRCPGARPVVSWRDDDEPDYLARVRELTRARADLSRRGVWHGHLASLDLHEPDVDTFEARWAEARPIVLPGAAAPGLPSSEPELYERLHQPGGLLRLAEELPRGFRVRADSLPLADPERDLEKVPLTFEDDLENLWMKTGRLSTHRGDASLRLRVSCGEEGRDDALDDPYRNRILADLAQALLPGTELAHENEPLLALVERLAEVRVQPTQHIAYWNAPEGGALFHHDAFAEAYERRQLGVLYLQLHGRTAWLALSIGDLAARLREFAEWLEAELPVEDAELLRELAAPGCGRLAWMVNRPELTGMLADAGHAHLLEPGDAILLPNHGFERTAMHSVFCASPEMTYGLSLALRRG